MNDKCQKIFKSLLWSKLLFWSLMCGLIFAQFHLFGNTTETNIYGRSAFNWMLTLWKSGRIFGGNIYFLGWIIPVATLALIYLRRREIARASRSVCWPALLVVILALFLHWAGARAQQTRLSLLALILLFWAIPFFLHGWPLARQLIFPIGLLVFCVPLNFLDAFTFPMRVFSAAGAHLLAQGLGFSVERAGSVIRIVEPSATLDGSDPASGLGTLLSLVAMTLIAGAWLRDPWWIRVLIPVVTPACMIAAGALRLLLGIVIVKWGSPHAALLFHEQAGLIFMLGTTLACLAFIRIRLLRLTGP